jgi:hypothetical protein
MDVVLKDYPSRDFSVPEGITFAKIDTETGMLAQPTCPHVALQAFAKDTQPTQICNVDHSKPIGLNPAFMSPGELTIPLGTTSQILTPIPSGQEGLPPLPEDQAPQNSDAVLLQ